MTAHDSNAPSAKKADGPDGEQSANISRRQYLGAAAALPVIGSGASAASERGAAEQQTDAESNGYEPTIEQGDGAVRADCGSVSTYGPVAEMFAIPEDSEIDITGHRAPDEGERNVEMDIHTGRDEPRLTMKQILSPADAREIGERLIAAADVAAGVDTAQD